MRVLIVLTTKFGEELTDLELQIGRQRGGQHVGLLQLDTGVAVLIEFIDDVAEPLEVRIYRSVERELDIRNGKAVHVRVVIADLYCTDIGLAGPSCIRQSDKADIHVTTGGPRS